MKAAKYKICKVVLIIFMIIAVIGTAMNMMNYILSRGATIVISYDGIDIRYVNPEYAIDWSTEWLYILGIFLGGAVIILFGIVTYHRINQAKAREKEKALEEEKSDTQ